MVVDKNSEVSKRRDSKKELFKVNLSIAVFIAVSNDLFNHLHFDPEVVP